MADLILHRVRLASSDGFGRAVPLEPFALLIRQLQLLAAQATVLAFRGTSAKPPRGAGFEEMLAMRLCDQAGDPATGDSILTFGAPRLGEAAPEVYGQSLIPGITDHRPPREATCFDLLAATLLDLIGGNQDSPRLDQGLLHTVADMQGVFIPPHRFSALWLESRRHLGTPQEHAVVCAVTRVTCQTAAAWSAVIPEARIVRLTGRLDMVQLSSASFVLTLDHNGGTVPGVVTDGDVHRLTGLLGRRITVIGRAIHRPSGRILRLEAQGLAIHDGEGPQDDEDPANLVVILDGPEEQGSGPVGMGSPGV